ncbi:MAG: hypothetical protein ABFD81_01720 [Syntrophaceae bacterium]
MRFLKPLIPSDHGEMAKACGQWFRDELGLKIVEYNLGNTFTGSIDILATDGQHLFLITVCSTLVEEALLRALTGLWWFSANKTFLARVFSKTELDLTLPPQIMILAPNFPPEAKAILAQALTVPVRLFRYMAFGSETNPEVFIEELGSTHAAQPSVATAEDFDALRQELGIEKASLSDEEIRDFKSTMRGI